MADLKDFAISRLDRDLITFTDIQIHDKGSVVF